MQFCDFRSKSVCHFPQINVAVGHVNDISHKNRYGIDTLMKEVSHFKV